MSVTLQELARLAKVSPSTVSRALNNTGRPVSAATKQRILTLARDLNYHPNMVARGLKTDQTLTIGIITDTIASTFTPIIVRSIQDYLTKYGYLALIVNGDWDVKTETKAVHYLLSRSIDGFIFVESWLRNPDSLRHLTHKPCVFVHHLFADERYRDYVEADEQYGARLAVEHLAHLGHRRIAFINGPKGWYASDNRLRGYQATLAQLGIAFDPEIVLEGDWDVPGGSLATRKLLSLPQPPTAIFAANDFMALGAIYALRESGLRVPEDIAIVGYDDREICRLAQPTITTVAMPCYEMGQAVAELLLSRIEKEDSKEFIKVQGKLIVRESCGTPGPKLPLEEKHRVSSVNLRQEPFGGYGW